ncbi:MAG: S-methyl-5'-thioadenosine phosphorylase [Rhizobiales bacterium]|nr:S-methyl-5'-thioadenosine phosphorylase [Hyphomicrobiales bacterium]
MRTMLGVIGGSGLYHLTELEIRERRRVPTPYGDPSDQITIGVLNGVEIAFLPRHGASHGHTPTELPYQANIYALKSLGVTHLLTVSAVGSLNASLPPLTVVLPDQIIDRSTDRPRTFFGGGAVAHVGLAHPYCHVFREAIRNAAIGAGVQVANGGTYLCIEGPQFSTRAESNLYRQWGADIIGMTAMPEARLAREAELCYATLAMVTDFDVWHESEEHVTVELVTANLHKNADVARRLVRAIAAAGLPERSCSCQSIPAETRQRLSLIVDRYLPPA